MLLFICRSRTINFAYKKEAVLPIHFNKRCPDNKKIFGTKKIPYSEFKEAGNTFVPMLYGVAMIYTSKSEIIRLDYTYLMGGVKFILYFSEFIGHSLDDDLTQEVLKRVHRNSALASREEKRELKKRKKYVREKIC